MAHHAIPVTLCIVLVISADAVRAQHSEPSAVTALEVTETIRIDGRLEEAVWSHAQHVTNFTQRELDFGAPASERTEVAILFDRAALYIGF